MPARFFLPGGIQVSPDSLRIPKAVDLVARLRAGAVPNAELVECRHMGAAEKVVFDVRLEVPNRRVHGVMRRERIAATFTEADDRMPEVEALRLDFPLVPHTNLRPRGQARSLCLYEQSYEELRLEWTAPRFVRRICEWLELMARGALHQNDQRLEPLLLDFAGRIVLPPDLATQTSDQLFVRGIPPASGKLFLVASREPPPEDEEGRRVVARLFRGRPRTHGLIHPCPTNLAEVAEIAREAGFDLIAELRPPLIEWKEKSLPADVVLVLQFPRTRIDGGAIEDHQFWCFYVSGTVRDLGLALGVWDATGGNLGTLLPGAVEARAQDVIVSVLNPCFGLTRDAAAKLNGREGAVDLKIVGVGVGSLGSHVVMNVARAGFGRWTLVDPDRLMPHNVARHALGRSAVGWPKATAIGFSADALPAERGAFQAVNADLLRPGENAGEVAAAISSANAIVEMTATVSVPRHLARSVESDARRLSAFLNPSGSDLVLLAEDAARDFPLDALEMQYYRGLLRLPELAGHLEHPVGRQWYARSCGDVTSTMPHDAVALHAAIASKEIKDVLAAPGPLIGVWRADASFAVRHVAVEPQAVYEHRCGPWTVVLDEGLRTRLSEHRAARLPNETGGVLLGAFDQHRRIIYVVDTLPSPSDSEERRDLYIRGREGLTAAIEAVTKKTSHMLEYIGEWHSHPRGSSTRPSDHDLAAFGWLTSLMAKDGLPAVMMIAGDGGAYRLFVGSMDKEFVPFPEHACVGILA